MLKNSIAYETDLRNFFINPKKIFSNEKSCQVVKYGEKTVSNSTLYIVYTENKG